MAEPWDHCAVLSQELASQGMRTELENMSKELAATKVSWLNAEVQLKDAEKAAARLRASEAQVSQLKDELNAARASSTGTQREVSQSSDSPAQVAKLEEELAGTKAMLAAQGSPAAAAAPLSYAAAAPPTAPAPAAASPPSNKDQEELRRLQAEVRSKLVDYEARVKAAEDRAKMAEEKVQVWENRALTAESRATDLALEITENSSLFQDAETRAERNELQCKELLSRLQEMQEQCIRLKVANDNHRMNVDLDRARQLRPRPDLPTDVNSMPAGPRPTAEQPLPESERLRPPGPPPGGPQYNPDARPGCVRSCG